MSWGVANISLLAYQILAAVYLLRRRRGYKVLPDGMNTHTDRKYITDDIFSQS